MCVCCFYHNQPMEILNFFTTKKKGIYIFRKSNNSDFIPQGPTWQLVQALVSTPSKFDTCKRLFGKVPANFTLQNLKVRLHDALLAAHIPRTRFGDTLASIANQVDPRVRSSLADTPKRYLNRLISYNDGLKTTFAPHVVQLLCDFANLCSRVCQAMAILMVSRRWVGSNALSVFPKHVVHVSGFSLVLFVFFVKSLICLFSLFFFCSLSVNCSIYC